eukprot:1935015-Rhodomonas_salina.2
MVLQGVLLRNLSFDFPVPPSPIVLRACYAMPGTDTGHHATHKTRHVVCGTELGYAATRLLRGVRYCPRLCCYARGTDHTLWRYQVECAEYADTSFALVRSAMLLRACYAMSGTHIAPV